MDHQPYSYPLGVPKLQLEITLLERMLEALSSQTDHYVKAGGLGGSSDGAALSVFYAVWSLGWVVTTERSEALDRNWGDKLESGSSFVEDLSEEDAHELLSFICRGEKWSGGYVGRQAENGNLGRLLKRLIQLKRVRADSVDVFMDGSGSIKALALRDDLVRAALLWQKMFGIAPSITSAISEFDAARLVGMSLEDYSAFMADRTAVSKGYDLICNGLRYQVKANRPSGKKGSQVTIVGKATNYDWDQLIWIHYDTNFIPREAWLWHVHSYREAFDQVVRLSPSDYRKGIKLDVSILLAQR